MEFAVSGECPCLCLHFIRQCVHRAVDAENVLPGEEVPENVRERTCQVVKAARWYAHNMLFRCGAILSAPYVDRRFIGMHVDVVGADDVQVGCGEYVVLEAVSPTETAMYVWGRARRTRSGARVIYPSAMGGSERFRVGTLEDVGTEYHGLVALVWDKEWKMDEEEYLYDEDTLARVLWYDLVILGSTRVFDRAGWDILYSPLSRWAGVVRDSSVIYYDV